MAHLNHFIPFLILQKIFLPERLRALFVPLSEPHIYLISHSFGCPKRSSSFNLITHHVMVTWGVEV
jgi:hypothetical protein